MKQMILLLLVLLACSPEQQEFQDLCEKSGYTWTKAQPAEAKPCYGCSIGNHTHLCSRGELEEWLTSNAG